MSRAAKIVALIALVALAPIAFALLADSTASRERQLLDRELSAEARSLAARVEYDQRQANNLLARFGPRVGTVPATPLSLCGESDHFGSSVRTLELVSAGLFTGGQVLSLGPRGVAEGLLRKHQIASGEARVLPLTQAPSGQWRQVFAVGQSTPGTVGFCEFALRLEPAAAGFAATLLPPGATTASRERPGERAVAQRVRTPIAGQPGWGVLVSTDKPSGAFRSNLLPLALLALGLLAIVVLLARRAAGSVRVSSLDPVTGLGTARRLRVDLERRLAHASDDEPFLLALFDLEGFQAYNDTFGRAAGDVMLTRLARNLTAAIGESGAAYRMGGDEFCILVGLSDEGQGVIITESKAALSERGDGFNISSSHGAILLPTESSDVDLALRLADQRLYSGKASQGAARRQSADVLLKALQERSPELGEHLRDVARLSSEVGRRLGMTGEELDELRQAAQLHDVGKMAIPDTILRKPGALDQEEWDFVRGHTVVGERIASAAPSLLGVARIIRSSHERFDGSGYPDGLKAEEIPLASRIIAVSDAYDAMIGPRPWRLGMSNGEALDELRSCGGAQFDPLVVEFFCSVVEELQLEGEHIPAPL